MFGPQWINTIELGRPRRSLICTKVGTGWGDFCNNCTTWRMLVLEDGANEYGVPKCSTKAFKYYGGHKICPTDPQFYFIQPHNYCNFPLCGEWKSGLFKN